MCVSGVGRQVRWGLVYCGLGHPGSPTGGFYSSSKPAWTGSPVESTLLEQRAKLAQPLEAQAGTPWLLPHAVDQSKSQASSHSRGGEKDSFLSKRSSKVTLPSSLDKRRGLICGHYCCLQQDYRDLTNITTPYILPPLPDCIFKQITLNPNRPFHNSRIWCWIWRSPINMEPSEILMWFYCTKF